MAIRALAACARSFGPAAAREKTALLDRIARLARIGARDLLVLHDTLCFLRAYPDNRALLERVEALCAALRERAGAALLENTGFPGSAQTHNFGYRVLRSMVRLFPGGIEVAWDELEDDWALLNALALIVTPGECAGLDDIRLPMEGWVERAKADPKTTDLEFLLDLFAHSQLDAEARAHVYDSCGLAVRYEGAGRCELAWRPGRIHYQARPPARDRAPPRSAIRRPLGGRQLRRGGTRHLALSLAALCCRRLEIPPLANASADDVTVADCGRGLRIVLAGTAPELRDPLESSYFALFLKNGMPIAYGPASICLGCCELGINLFPEFRGGEIRFVYAQYMRLLHQLLGAENFFLTSYAMGEANDAALRSGAFWFYRKLGFLPLNETVEALAREEERKMRAQPGYRCDLRTLRRLSHTEACYDLSGGACPRPDFAALGLKQTRLVAQRFSGDRARAERHWTARAASGLGIGGTRTWPEAERRALRILAPIVCMVGGMDRWSASDKRKAVRLIRIKGSRSEMRFDRALRAHRPLADGIREIRRNPRGRARTP